MKKIIATILLVVGIGLALFGYNKHDNAVESVKFMGLELSAEDKSKTSEAYMLIGLGALLAVGGIVGLVKN